MSRQPTTALPIPSRAQTETPEAELFYSSSLPKDSGSGSLSQRDGAALLDGFAAMRRASIVMTGEGAVAAHKGRARLVVQKFGGTSVGTAERLAMVASIVKWVDSRSEAGEIIRAGRDRERARGLGANLKPKPKGL